MKDVATHRLETFVRVRQFGTTHAQSLSAVPRGAEALSELNADIAELEGHTTAQASSARATKEGTTVKAGAFAALREDMEAINRTARAMAHTMPGLEEKFRLPRNAGVRAWLSAARSFAQDAEPIKSEFVRRGLPASFIEDLRADTDALESSIESRAQKKGARVAATASIDDAIERGMNAVRELDAIVRNTFRDDPATLAEWTSASHTERSPRAAHDATPPTQPAKA
jgi:hypothetical protein